VWTSIVPLAPGGPERDDIASCPTGGVASASVVGPVWTWASLVADVDRSVETVASWLEAKSEPERSRTWVGGFKVNRDRLMTVRCGPVNDDADECLSNALVAHAGMGRGWPNVWLTVRTEPGSWRGELDSEQTDIVTVMTGEEMQGSVVEQSLVQGASLSKVARFCGGVDRRAGAVRELDVTQRSDGIEVVGRGDANVDWGRGSDRATVPSGKDAGPAEPEVAQSSVQWSGATWSIVKRDAPSSRSAGANSAKS